MNLPINFPGQMFKVTVWHADQWSFFQNIFLGGTMFLYTCFLLMKMDTFRGDEADISAKKTSLMLTASSLDGELRERWQVNTI